MQSLYLATTFAAAVACLLTSLLLFARRKSGERSRLILSCIVMFSVGNYIMRFIDLSHGNEPKLVISVPMLLLALFMVISYIMYPIEVISPGYLNWRRIFKLYSPCLILAGIYSLSKQAGVTYPPYDSLLYMLPQFTEFHAWFRLLLALLIFAPVLFIFTIPHTRRYNNTDRSWIMRYTLCLTINTIAYMVVLMSDLLVIKTLYYYVSAGCSIYVAYLELFERLIGQHPVPVYETATVPADECNHVEISAESQNPLCERILLHMNHTCDYRNPDLSLNMLAGSLYTNRTTLSNALHELGYSSFNNYINTLRIEEFIRHIQNNKTSNYQDVFYEVGFRSRATALRNFKQYTGKTPSEYFSE